MKINGKCAENLFQKILLKKNTFLKKSYKNKEYFN